MGKDCVCQESKSWVLFLGCSNQRSILRYKNDRPLDAAPGKEHPFLAVQVLAEGLDRQLRKGRKCTGQLLGHDCLYENRPSFGQFTSISWEPVLRSVSASRLGVAHRPRTGSPRNTSLYPDQWAGHRTTFMAWTMVWG